eukprot:15471100-Alexandrium_andersonii.AAC.1
MLEDFRAAGLGPETSGVLEALLEAPQFRVKMNQECSEWKGQDRGVRQGCTRSPLLFIVQLSLVMHKVPITEARDRGLHLNMSKTKE